MSTKVLLLLLTTLFWWPLAVIGQQVNNGTVAILSIGLVSSQASLPVAQLSQQKCDQGRVLRKITGFYNGQPGKFIQSVYCAQWFDSTLALDNQQSTGEQFMSGSFQCPTGYAANGIKCTTVSCSTYRLYCSQFSVYMMDQQYQIQFTPGNLLAQCNDDEVITGIAINSNGSVRSRCSTGFITLSNAGNVACNIGGSSGNSLQKRGLDGWFSCFCSSKACFKVQLIFLSQILEDGFGDAVGLARTLAMILKLYPNFNFRVIILDDSEQKSGFGKFREMAVNLGIDKRLRLDLISLTEQAICNELEPLASSPSTVFFEGPAEASRMTCTTLDRTKIANLIQILELGVAVNSYGLNRLGFGMPIPASSEFSYLSTATFSSRVLQSLFSQNKRPLAVYMKNGGSIKGLIKEVNSFLGNNINPLDVIVFGYEKSSLGEELCRILPHIRYLTSDGNDITSDQIKCSSETVRSINVYHFNSGGLQQVEFVLAMSKSFDIVGVTGDQSFLEALALGKIPARDFMIGHKLGFNDAWQEFIKERVSEDSFLYRFVYNARNTLERNFVREAVNITELPAMKSDMNKLMQILRGEFDPIPRLKSVIERTLS